MTHQARGWIILNIIFSIFICAWHGYIICQTFDAWFIEKWYYALATFFFGKIKKIHTTTQYLFELLCGCERVSFNRPNFIPTRSSVHLLIFFSTRIPCGPGKIGGDAYIHMRNTNATGSTFPRSMPVAKHTHTLYTLLLRVVAHYCATLLSDKLIYLLLLYILYNNIGATFLDTAHVIVINGVNARA